MPAPLILVVAPIASHVAAGVAVVATALAAPLMYGIEVLIQAIRNPKIRPLTEAEKASLARQDALLQERSTAFIAIADNTLKSAAQAEEVNTVLNNEQRDAADLLLEATGEVKTATTALVMMNESSHEKNAAFTEVLTLQVPQLVTTAQSIGDNMTLLSQALVDKQHIIDRLQAQLSTLQAESAEKEATLETIRIQVSVLAGSQTKTIARLQSENTALMTSIQALTQELDQLTSVTIEDNYQKITTPTTTFFQ